MPASIHPKLGILGGGQLAWMLGKAAAELGVECHFFLQKKEEPVSRLGDFDTEFLHFGDAQSLEALSKFFQKVDVISFESEFWDADLLGKASQIKQTDLHEQVSFLPNLALLSRFQDKYYFIKHIGGC